MFSEPALTWVLDLSSCPLGLVEFSDWFPPDGGCVSASRSALKYMFREQPGQIPTTSFERKSRLL